MAGLCQVTPVVKKSGIQVPISVIEAAGGIFNEFIEPGLDVDFSFDLDDATSFGSRVSPFELDRTGKTVALQKDTAGKQLRIAPGGLNGLITPTADQREMTYFGIFNYRPLEAANAIQVLAGTAEETSAEGGEYLFMSSGRTIQANIRGYSGNIAGPSLATLQGLGLSSTADTVSLFIALSSALTHNEAVENETTHTLFVGAPVPIVKTLTGVKTLSTKGNRLAIGNAYISTANYDTMAIRTARFGCGSIEGGLSVDELTAIYERAKVYAALDRVPLF